MKLPRAISQFRPLLAASVNDLTDVQYPCYLLPKLDGIRCLYLSGQVLARSLKPIANRYINRVLSEILSGMPDLDGELVVGSVLSADSRRVTQSAVNSQYGEPQFMYYVFDSPEHPDQPFDMRYRSVLSAINALNLKYRLDSESHVRIIRCRRIYTAADLLAAYQKYIEIGCEGIILRDPNALYKFGRSTLSSGEMLRMKPIETDEGTIIGVSQLFTNANEQMTSRLGYAKRSSHQSGKIPRDSLGALIVTSRDYPGGFQIGTGFTMLQRRMFWQSRESLIGRKIEFRYSPAGSYERPNSPVFIRMVRTQSYYSESE